jgi:hypothetical protein
MHYYFERSIIRPLTRIRRERRLPYPGELTVRAGQEVTPIQVIARAEEPANFLVVDMGERLGISTAELAKYLVVQPGQQVERGRPLWRKKGFLGGKRQYKSPVDGIFMGAMDQYLILQPFTNAIELRAMMPGQVAAINPGRSVTLEVDGALIQPIWSVGADSYGKLKTVVTAPEMALLPEHLTNEIRGAVLVAGRVTELDLLARAEELGARGLIVGSAPADLLLAAQSTGLTLMVTEGVGWQPMAAPVFDFLAQAQEREVGLFVHDPQERGDRPEIVAPLPVSGAAEPPPPPPPQLAVGQQVRLLRDPYSGQVGKIIAVYAQAQITEIGGQWPGVDVQLSGGEVIYMPRANLDLIV